jgi:hypothetical protein
MPGECRWPYRSAGLRGLSFRFGVRCDDARLGAQIDALFAGLREPDGAPVEHWYSLTTATAPTCGVGTFDVRRDDETLAYDQRAGDALGWIVWDVNRSAAAASGAHLLFHAGALEVDGAALLLPGTSGSGKSTLTAGLVTRVGLGYLTDELAAQDLNSGRLLPYAKPITVKRGSFDVVPELHPDRRSGPGAASWAGEEWQVAVGGIGAEHIGRPCPLRWVIVPRYVPGASTALTPLSDTEAFLTLALHAVNLLPHGAAGSAALGRMVADACCYTLTMSDLDEACALVRGLVTTGAPASGAAASGALLDGAGHAS